MSEGYNPFPGTLVVENICELQNASTDGLDEGCLVYVKNKDSGPAADYHYFRLYDYRDAMIPPLNGTTILSTYNGPAAVKQGATPATANNGLCDVQNDAHRDTGTMRWILTDIQDE